MTDAPMLHAETDARRVLLAALRAVADPTLDWPWVSTPPDHPMTLAEAMARTPRSEPLDDHETHSYSAQPHLDRIAFFVRTGWDEPINLDIASPLGGGWWPVTDGNHRLYAAIVRDDEHVEVVISGDVEWANTQLLPDNAW